jgi:hypothetical protein
MGSDIKIIGFGGYVDFQTFPYLTNEGRMPIGQANTIGANIRGSCYIFLERAAGSGSSFTLYLQADTTSSLQTPYKYDVWVRYTK